MIEIREIIESSIFPVIEFKLQNTSQAQALLKRFRVHVKEVAIDTAPVLVASAVLVRSSASSCQPGSVGEMLNQERVRSEGGACSIRIHVRNNGWGPANDLHVSVEGAFASIFPKWKSVPFGTIDSYREVVASRLLGASDVEPHALAAALDSQRSEQSNSFRSFHSELGIPVEGLPIRCCFRDDQGTTHSEILEVRPPGDGSLFLTATGFVYQDCVVVQACMMLPPETIYYSAIDVKKVMQEKEYKLSHVMQPGEIENLAIMIGAEKSCHARVHFSFLLDRSTIVSSDEFRLHIDNPIGMHHYARLVDGDELLSKLGKGHSAVLERKNPKTRGSDRDRCWNEFWNESPVMLPSFPFLPARRR